jgi:hypothetical protein
MTAYQVVWYIEVEAESELDAAEQALGIHRDPESVATIFSVRGPDRAVCLDALDGTEYPSDLPRWVQP